MKFSQEIYKIVYENCESSTSHGLPSIVRNKNWFIKILWIICLLISSSYCVYCLKKSFGDYFSFETITKINHKRLSSIQFPTVTFCNKNPLNIFRNDDISVRIKEEIEIIKSQLNYRHPIINDSFEYMSFAEYLSLYTIIYFKSYLKYISYDIDDMLLNCRYNNLVCTRDDFEHYLMPQYGNCYKFNSGKNLYGKNTSIKNASVPGVNFGLRLELFVGNPTFEYDLYKTRGIQLFIHNNSFVPSSTSDAILISTGFETDIVLSQEYNIKLPKPYGNCIEDTYSENSFDSFLYKETVRVFGKYQQKNCLTRCGDEYIRSVCGCYHPNVYGIEFSQSCNISITLECFVQAQVLFYNSSLLNECFDKCPEECNSVKYHYRISHDEFPSPFYADVLMRQNIQNMNSIRNFSTYEQVRKTVLLINVYHDDIAINFIEQVQSKTIEQVVADVGGFLGLCIGISLLSVVEIFEVMFKILFLFLFQKSKVDIKVEPM